mmetsp:Transcript_32335/g.81468  ORF Transcript_32335/g.81468 Transcript_32335/m.81468 type:complete len:350 (+) Transcript_32335:2286-3335(+)
MYRSLSTAEATSAESWMRTPWWTSYLSLSPRRIEMVSSTDGASTRTCWKRLSSAGSFSMYLRCSSRVVAPMHLSCPLASRGFRRLDASIDPSVAPAPTTVWISSINMMICPSESVTSLITALSRSSNSPLYLAPATKAPMSSEKSFLPSRLEGTSPAAMRDARPSAIAVLPTPGSPISTGLFLVRRDRIWIVRLISSSRPITGSSFPFLASSVRSLPYLASASYVPSGVLVVTFWFPRTLRIASSTPRGDRPYFSSTPICATFLLLHTATRRCSTDVKSSCMLRCSALASVSTSRRLEPIALVPVPDTLGCLAMYASTSCTRRDIMEEKAPFPAALLRMRWQVSSCSRL